MEKLWLFGLFSGDRGDNIDMRMIKITIKANQIDMGVLLISKVDNIQKPCLSQSPALSIILLVCEFYPHGQTWYQKFIRTYPPLKDLLEDTTRAWETDADSYSAHLKASVVQLFQHCFGVKVTILMVKRVEVQRIYFAPSER